MGQIFINDDKFITASPGRIKIFINIRPRSSSSTLSSANKTRICRIYHHLRSAPTADRVYKLSTKPHKPGFRTFELDSTRTRSPESSRPMELTNRRHIQGKKRSRCHSRARASRVRVVCPSGLGIKSHHKPASTSIVRTRIKSADLKIKEEKFKSDTTSSQIIGRVLVMVAKQTTDQSLNRTLLRSDRSGKLARRSTAKFYITWIKASNQREKDKSNVHS